MVYSKSPTQKAVASQKSSLDSRRKSQAEDDFDSDDSDVEDDEDDADLAGLDVESDASRPKTLTRKEVMEIVQTSRSFVGMDIRKANLTKMDLSNCDFTDSNCSYVNFKDSNLENANFTNSSLWNANLEGANLTRANLEDADLDYTKLRGAVLYKANIKRTTLPTELVPRDDILKSVNEGTKINR
jgi:uncharacterized protein YjbI with pentapeptide repeats